MQQTQPIRILQVLTIMNRGGAETMIMNYYRHMDRSKVQFDFLLHRKEAGAYDDEILALGGRIFKLDAIQPLRYRKYKKELEAFFRLHPEFKIVHSHLNALSFLVLGVARKEGIPFRIAHSHLAVKPKSFLRIFKKNSDSRALLKDLIQHILRHQVRKVATHSFACGQEAGNWLFGNRAKNRIRVINNAIDASYFIYDPQVRQEVREELYLENKKVLGHVGRFNEQKNHEFLVDILSAVVAKDQNIHLILVGTGLLETTIKQRVTDLGLTNHVTFLGIRKDIYRLLQAFDLFVFPSLFEGLPVTLIEAQASGLRIITSDRVTKEADLTGLVEFLPLEAGPGFWASQVLSVIDYPRQNTYAQIEKGKYDIAANASELEEFYLNFH